MTPPWCLRCVLRNRGLAADVVVNVLLFAPIGAGLRLVGLPTFTVAAMSLALSVGVEVLQAYVISGRVANVADVVTNTLGASLAAIAAPRWPVVVWPTRRAALSLALAWLSGVAAIVALSAWSLRPVTTPAPLVARGLATGASRDHAERVLHAAVQTKPVVNGDTVAVVWLSRRPVSITVGLQASRARWKREPGFNLEADGQRLLQLGIDDGALELEVRRRGESLRLLSPSVRLRRPAWRLDGMELDTLVLRGDVTPWRMRLAVQSKAARDDLVLRLHPLAGWSLLVATPRSRWRADVLTLLWTSGLVFPAAYWGASSLRAAGRRQARWVLWALAAAMLGGVAGVAAVARAPLPEWSALVGVVGGCLAGYAAARAAAINGEPTR